MPQPWIFRVASKPEVGGGHVSRCLSIAKALKPMNDVRFILDEGGEDWIERLGAEGFQAVITGNEGEVGEPWSGCLLDGYDFSEDDANFWKRKAAKLIVFDDFGSPPQYADLALAPVFAPETDEINGVLRIGGPGHALVDSRYATTEFPPISGEVKSILVSFGLRDSANATTTVVKAFELLAHDGFAAEITICLGRHAPHLDEVKRLIPQTGLPIDLALDQPGLLELLSTTDLVLGGGGVSLLERMAAGRPSISTAVVDNQRPQIEWAAALGATLDGGSVANVEPGPLASMIAEITEDTALRRAMSATARTIIDGRGAERIATTLAAYSDQSQTSRETNHVRRHRHF